MELGDPGRRAQRRIWIIYPFEKRKEVFLLKKSWRNFSKRGLSLLVCLVMCLSMLPGVAYAEENPTVCGNCASTDIAPAHGHSGHYECNNCHAIYKPNSGWNGGCNHVNTEIRDAEAATCTEKGYTGNSCCTKCGAIISAGTIIEALGHSYSYTDNKDGTHKAVCAYNENHTIFCEPCSYEGGKCAKCSAVACDHSSATCADGTTCPTCGATVTAKDHTLTHHEAVAATCIVTGAIEYWSCSACGKNFSDGAGTMEVESTVEQINPNNHVSTSYTYEQIDENQHAVICACNARLRTEAHDLDHTHDDATGHHCECVCGKKNITAHTYGDWTITTEPSCTTPGERQRQCSVCNFREYETIPTTGEHEWATDWSKDASGHWYECSVCYAKKNEASHTYGEPEYVFTPGSNKFIGGKLESVSTCTACGHEKREMVQNSGVKESTSAATCTEPGKTVYSWGNKINPGGSVTVIHPDEPALKHLPPSGEWNQYGVSLGYTNEHVKLCGRENPNTNRPCTAVVAHEAHSYLTEETFKEPTCTEKGYTWNKCKDCGWNKGGKELAPLGHDYGDPTWKWNATSGSATATFTCTRNGCTHVETVKAGVTSVTEPANCIKEGSITYMATVTFNEKTYTAEKVVTTPATGIHDYDEDGVCKICGDVHPTDHKHVYDMEKGTVTTKATCTMQGVTSYPCKYCNATLEVVALPLGHEYTSEVTTPATCIAEGVQTYTCHREGCSDFYTEGLPLVPHTLTVHAKKEPACTENGMKAHSTCSVCNGFFTGAGTSLEETAEDDLVILATNHTYEAVVTAPACTEGGYTTHTCTKCGDSYTDTQTNAVGHAYDAWIITAAPTMSAPGEARRICANDESHVETVELPQLPAPGTPDSVWTLDTERSAAPTCTESGENMYVSVYGEVRANVPALGHSFSDTWTYDGASHWHACARCGIAGGAAAHAYDGGVVTLAPTADTAGVRTYTCTACGRYYTEAIPATGTTGPVFPAPDPGTPGGGSGGTNNPPPAETIIDEDTPLADITFDDVMPTDPFYEAVQYVFNRKLMNGVSDTSFDPYGTLTRAMVVTILYRLEGEPAAEPSAFLDVAAGQWYTDAVGWGAANKVVKGYSEDRFGPMDPVTREQLAAILHRYAQYKGYEVTEITDLTAYADMASISEYALEAMAWAIALGAPEALSDTALAPRDNATRAQVAVAFMNFCEKYIPLETEGEAA